MIIFSHSNNHLKVAPLRFPAIRYYLIVTFHLQWLEDDFIRYLDKSVQSLHRITKMKSNKMLLTPETRLGLRTTNKTNYCAYLFMQHFLFFLISTVKPFVELVRFLFTIPGVTCFLSEKLCQDPLENFFGCQRQREGVNETLTAQEFCKNTQALRVINSQCQQVTRGNCRVRKLQAID